MSEVTTRDVGHGRVEVRTLTVCSADGVDWPGCEQVCRVQRLRCLFNKDEATVETVYVVTSLSAEEASAEALLALNRGHWSIENQLHYVRDVTMGEDSSQVGAGNGPTVMAALRNTVISLLRKNGFRSVAAALREMSTDIPAALTMVGLRWLPD